MTTRGIPRDEWASFFDAFERMHKGWLVTIEVLRRDIGAQIEAESLPLQGILLDERGGRTDLAIEGAPERRLVHAIPDPRRVYLQETAEGAHETLEFESSDGGKTLLRFHSAARPEALDGHGP